MSTEACSYFSLTWDIFLCHVVLIVNVITFSILAALAIWLRQPIMAAVSLAKQLQATPEHNATHLSQTQRSMPKCDDNALVKMVKKTPTTCDASSLADASAQGRALQSNGRRRSLRFANS